MSTNIDLGDGCFINDETPTNKVRDLLSYFLHENHPDSDCEWDLSKILLAKDDMVPEDFFLVFSHFDGINFSEKLNQEINELAYKTWLKLKEKTVPSKYLVIFSQFYFEKIETEAWSIIESTVLDADDLIRIILRSKKINEINYAFIKIDSMTIEDLQMDKIHRLISIITNSKTTDELRLKYFSLLQKQKLIIEKYGKVELDYIRVGYKGAYPGDVRYQWEHCVLLPKDKGTIRLTAG